MAEQYVPHDNPNIVIIGGGGGTSAIFPGIVKWTKNAVAAICMTDSGGSTKRLMDEFDGMLPMGDLRNVAMATSENDEIRDMRQHRYAGNGALKGHSVGNLVFTAYLSDPKLALQDAIDRACRFLQVPGRLMPIITKHTQLVMYDGETDDGEPRIIRGEHEIDEYETKSAKPRVVLEPPVPLNPDVASAIAVADMIVIPGGSIYTSLLATWAAEGILDAVRAADVPVVLVANLATDEMQTSGWHVADEVLALERHGIRVSDVLYNTEQPTDEMLAKYAAKKQYPIDARPEGFLRIPHVRAIGANLLSHEVYSPNPNDPIERGLMRHDPDAVAEQLQQLHAGYRAAA